MTNLTSEQYRDILHNVEGYTEPTPSVQNVLRRAVETFYKSFGCYPEAAGASPGSGVLFGEQTQFDEGLTFAVPTPMVTVVVGRKVPGNRVTVVTTADVGKPHKVCFGLSRCSLSCGEPLWVKYIKCVTAIYCCRSPVSAFEAAVESSLPLGVGFGSAAALEIATFTFFEVLFGNKLHPIDKAVACQNAEEEFFGRKVGNAARICASTAKDRHAMLIDGMRSQVEWVPFKHDKVVLVGVDFHCRDTLFGEEYLERTKYLKKACDILGVENLRSAQIEDIIVLEENIKQEEEMLGEASERRTLTGDEWSEEKLDTVVKRARFYVMETRRVEEATEAWKEGDVEAFGQKMVESHLSLKEDFGFDNPVLDFVVETSLQAEGVLGSKMIGLGLNSGGCVLTLVYKENLVQYCEFVRTKFAEKRAELTRMMNENLEKYINEQIGGRQEEREKSEESQTKKKDKEADDLNSVTNWEAKAVDVEEEEKEQKLLDMPSFYIINPVAGARMMFPIRTDLLRSRFARRVPQAKELVKNAMDELYNNYQKRPEVVALSPATTTLFGEFLDHHRGYIIAMALPLLTVTVGCRNSGATFRLKTTSKEVGERTEFQSPIPGVGTLGVETDNWIDRAVRTVYAFKGQVPGFIGVIESSIPCEIGIHSCSAFQGSIYQFLEGLTGSCTADPLEKVDLCRKASARYVKDAEPVISKCSKIRFFPTFLSKEGYVLLINCRTLKMANYYLDHPSYVFLLACCRERSSTVTVQDIADRIRACHEAAGIIGRDTLVNGDERHIRCLRKRGVPEEIVRKVKYIITEQQRCVRAIEAIKRDDYQNLGVLMTQSHCSLRDDFEVSTREVEVIVNLALSVDGVLGAKLAGRGLTSTALILAKLSSVDNCIKYVRKNYVPKWDKPFFYVFKPSSGACIMDLEDCMSIP